MSDLTKRDVMTLEWLTVGECAHEINVAAAVVYAWCRAWESGDDTGLRNTHYGALPADKAERRNRRIHIDDWKEFKKRRQAADRQQEQRIVRSFSVEPRHYPERPSRRAVASEQGQ